MTEMEWRWVIPAAIVAVFLIAHAWSVRSERRRRAWFDAVAAALKAKAEHGPEDCSQCIVTIGGRSMAIAHGYVGRQMGMSLRPGRTLRCAIPLKGVPDIYNFRFRTTGGGAVESTVHGYAPHENWQTPALRQALTALFENASRFDTLDAEGGALVFRSFNRYDGPALRAILSRQIAVADALERTL
jgi:hypothetical protein